MTKISLFTPINYAIPCSCAQGALSILSNYFYLGGTRATVVKGDEVRLENGKVSKSTIALKVASYVFLFPLTLTLLAIDLAIRSRYHFTVITPSKKSSQAPVPVTPERESTTTHPSTVTITAQPIERVRQEIIPTPQKETSFHPFAIKISKESLPHPIHSYSKMHQKALEIGQQVLDEHVKLRIDIPSHGQEKIQAMEFLEELKSVVDVISTRRGDLFYIVPKKTEEIQENRSIRKYENGIVEEVICSRESEGGGDLWTYWNGRRIYPNGIIERGRFDNFLWYKGTREEKGTITYRLPSAYTLIMSYGLDCGLMYAGLEGEKELIVIRKKPGSSYYSSDYVQVKEELIPTLTEILKFENDVCKTPLREILSGSINCEEFINFLFKTNSIFSLQPYPLQILLEIIQEKKLTVNLHHQDPETRETLLIRYSGNTEILKNLLTMDPTLIQRRKGEESAFVRALLSGNKEGASLLFNTMEKQNISLLPRELLFKKVAFSEGDVTLEELRKIPSTDQEIVYRLANIYSQLNVIRTMRTMNFSRRDELIMREGPSIFGCNMDALEMQEQLQNFLTDLRSKKLLLTQSEFGQLPAKNYIKKAGNVFMSLTKGSDIGRILGRNYIEKKAKELGLKHVKVPKKMIVLDADNTHLKLRTSAGLDIRAPSGGITVYAERIQGSNRKITSEETSELLLLFEATGFSDIQWKNVIVAEDGVYITDTEFSNFWVARYYFLNGHHYDAGFSSNFLASKRYFDNGNQYAEMEKIVHALPIEQQKKLIDELNKKMKTYQQNEEEFNKQRNLRLQVEQAALQKSGCFYGPTFTFPVNELII